MEVTTIYTARDFRDFDTEEECRAHEKFLDLTESIAEDRFLLNSFICERTVTVTNATGPLHKWMPLKSGHEYDGRELYQGISKLLKPRDYVKYFWKCRRIPTTDKDTFMTDIYIEYEIEKPCFLIETSGGKDLRFPCKAEDLKDIEEYKVKNSNKTLYEIKPCRCSFANLVVTDVTRSKNAFLKMNKHPYYEGDYSLVDKEGNNIYPL